MAHSHFDSVYNAEKSSDYAEDADVSKLHVCRSAPHPVRCPVKILQSKICQILKVYKEMEENSKLEYSTYRTVFLIYKFFSIYNVSFQNHALALVGK